MRNALSCGDVRFAREGPETGCCPSLAGRDRSVLTPSVAGEDLLSICPFCLFFWISEETWKKWESFEVFYSSVQDAVAFWVGGVRPWGHAASCTVFLTPGSVLRRVCTSGIHPTPPASLGPHRTCQSHHFLLPPPVFPTTIAGCPVGGEGWREGWHPRGVVPVHAVPPMPGCTLVCDGTPPTAPGDTRPPCTAVPS